MKLPSNDYKEIELFAFKRKSFKSVKNWAQTRLEIFSTKCVKTSYRIRGSLNKFPDFFRMGTFIDSTRMKLLSPSK